jgi:protein-disulfide isomerase
MTMLKKSVFVAALLFAGAIALQSPARAQSAGADALAEALILRDPEVPVLGNAKGDITIVEYFDYRCPYCKTVNPVISKIVKEDGHIRLVFKDWPVFGDVSVTAAKLALAAKYQNKYAEAHEALISMREKLTEANLFSTLAAAGVDVDRAKSDLASNEAAIGATLARNSEQAEAFGFQGTPAFIVGRFRIPGAMSADNFKRAIADARAATKAK